MLPRSLFTKDKQYEILIHGYDEPNNGRELWIASVHSINDQNKVPIPKLIDLPINFQLEQWILEDEQEEWMYLPRESQAILFRKKDQQIHQLPYWGLSTIQFLGNDFVFNYLVESFKNGIRITNLESLESQNISLEKGNTLNKAKLSSPNTLLVEVLEQGIRKQQFHNISWNQ